MPGPAGEELAYRMEMERAGEAAGEGRATRPGTPSRQESGRQAERRTALTAARDIRTSGPAAVSAEQDSAAAQKRVSAPGLASDVVRAGEQPGAPRTMPGLIGEELAYRMEEERGGGDTGEGRAARPGTPSRQTSGRETEQSPARRGQGREEASVPEAPEVSARQAERRTALTAARDIRTSNAATASAEQDTAAAQKMVPAPGLASDAMRAGEQPGAPRTMPGPAGDRKSTRLNSSHQPQSRMPSSA